MLPEVRLVSFVGWLCGANTANPAEIGPYAECGNCIQATAPEARSVRIAASS